MTKKKGHKQQQNQQCLGDRAQQKHNALPQGIQNCSYQLSQGKKIEDLASSLFSAQIKLNSIQEQKQKANINSIDTRVYNSLCEKPLI